MLGQSDVSSWRLREGINRTSDQVTHNIVEIFCDIDTRLKTGDEAPVRFQPEFGEDPESASSRKVLRSCSYTPEDG